MTAINEGSTFGHSPFVDFPTLYALAVPCAIYLMARFDKHGFWVLALLATLGALAAWRLVGISFGNRYAFFAAFFAQFLVAEVMALGVLALVREPSELAPDRPWRWLDRPFSIGVLAVACLVWLPSPMIRQARKTGELGALPSPGELFDRPSPHDAYYDRFAALRPLVSRRDVVMMPHSRTVFDFASITGARVVSSPNAHQILDRNLRASDVARFFEDDTDRDVRVHMVDYYRVTKVLVPKDHFELAPALVEIFGEPVYQSDEYALWAVPSKS
jgi:hypothetical protein